MKTVLMLVHDDAGQAARLHAALALVHALDGHMACLDIERVPELPGDFADGVTVRFPVQEHGRAMENRVRIARRLDQERVSCEWTHDRGDIEAILCKRVGLADILVLNSNLDDPNLMPPRGMVSAAVLKTGRPVLAVPKPCLDFSPAGLVVIAWDGSPPVLAALRAAVPLLAVARTVALVEVGATDADATPAEAGAAYLSRHGIPVGIHRVSTQGMMSPSAKLLDITRTMRASYIVMGAFGHSRLSEAIFGGVTRSMLLSAPIPLFLAH